jgi:exodeoxyribonuclease V
MTESEIRAGLIGALPFEPTSGQYELISRLSGFLFRGDEKQLFVLRGYAGTGKTSMVSALVKVLPSLNFKSVLLAPTGRAAKVMAGYSGKTAQTIHKRIYFQKFTPDGRMVLTMQKNLFRKAVFIVDEASMIPGESMEQEQLFSAHNLLDDLMDYVFSGKDCRVIFIGDTAQLPPVGTELSPALNARYLKSRYSVDIIEYELDQVMRQSLESGVLSNATRIRNMIGEADPSVQVFDLNDQEDVQEVSSDYLEDLLIDSYSDDKIEGSIIVTRSNKRANLYNREIRNRILYREYEIEAGDLMMIVKNNYFWLPENSEAGFLANGDIIEIMGVRNFEEVHGFRFADVTIRLLDYPDQQPLDVKIILDTIMAESPSLSREDGRKLYLNVLQDYEDIPEKSKRADKVRVDPYYNSLQVKFAYAMTCHKTQGGQWEQVFIDYFRITPETLDRSALRWLYTAVTRSTNKVYLLGYPDHCFVR